MKKPSPTQILVGVGGAAVLLLSSSSNAFAGNDAPKIWVDVRPWTCAAELGPFARQIHLACDSLGGTCEIAPSAKEADYRASLACGEPESWTMVLQKSNGAEVLTLALDGDREQRLRKAALWVAHASLGKPPPRRAQPAPAPVPAEPPPAALLPADLPAELPPAYPDEPEPIPAPPARFEVVPVPVARPPVKPLRVRPQEEKSGGIAVSGLGGITSRGSMVAGGRAYVAFPLGAGLSLAPVFNYARGLGHDRGNLLLGGAMLGWGAPFGGRWLGLSLEGGAGANVGRSGAGGFGPMERDGGRDDDGDRDRGRTPRHAFYGRVAGTLQIPVELPVRPFVSIAGSHVSNLFGRPAQMATLDVGFAWRAF